MLAFRKFLILGAFLTTGMTMFQKAAGQNKPDSVAALRAHYYNDDKKQQMYDKLMAAALDSNPVIHKVDAKDVPKDALDLGDFKARKDDTTFYAGDLLETCREQQSSAITYRRGDAHYVMENDDLQAIQTFYADVHHTLHLPQATDIWLTSEPVWEVDNDVSDTLSSNAGASFDFWEHVSLASGYAWLVHEGGHSWKFVADSNVPPDTSTATEEEIIDVACNEELKCDSIGGALLGPEKMEAGYMAAAGYANHVVPDTLRKKLVATTYSADLDIDKLHPALLLRCLFFEAWKERQAQGNDTPPPYPLRDATWKPKR